MNQKSALIISNIIILGMLILSLWTWVNIPDQPIPVHFGIDGQPDRYGSKFEGLLILPLISIACNLLFVLLPRLEPRRENLLRSGKAYDAVWLASIAVLAITHGSAITVVLGRSATLPMVVEVAIGSLLMIIGNYMAKIRSNFLFGIRTPWTLASEKSWYKSHRLGGWLLFGLGLGSIVVAITGNAVLFLWLLLGGTFSITITLFIYSYLIWKNDPDKESSQGE